MKVKVENSHHNLSSSTMMIMSSSQQEESKAPARSPQARRVKKSVVEREQEREDYLKHVNLTSEEL